MPPANLCPVFEYKFKDTKFSFNTTYCNLDLSDKICEAVAIARLDESIIKEIPMDVGETPDEYELRIKDKRAEIDDRKLIRQANESADAHSIRVKKPVMSTQKMGLTILNCIQDAQRERISNPEEAANRYPYIGEEEYRKTSWLNIKDFLHHMLDAIDIYVPEFYPKRTPQQQSEEPQ